MIEHLANIVTIISFVSIFIAYFSTKKQLYFSTIQKCTDDYRTLLDQYKDWKTNEEFLPKYLELVNEELFYIENNYLPKDVAVEWIDGMIDFLPLILKNSTIVNSNMVYITDIIVFKDKFRSYSRIYRFLQVDIDIDSQKLFLPVGNEENEHLRLNERAKLIKELFYNLKINKIDKSKINFYLQDYKRLK